MTHDKALIKRQLLLWKLKANKLILLNLIHLINEDLQQWQRIRFKSMILGLQIRYYFVLKVRKTNKDKGIQKHFQDLIGVSAERTCSLHIQNGATTQDFGI